MQFSKTELTGFMKAFLNILREEGLAYSVSDYRIKNIAPIVFPENLGK